MARRKLADPVFLLAGGPGQSAISVAASTMPIFARLNNRRDIVFVDQRGTGRSAPLQCPDPARRRSPSRPTPSASCASRCECRDALLKLPYITTGRATWASSPPRSPCRTSTRCGGARRRARRPGRRLVRHAGGARVPAPVPVARAAQRARRRRAARHGAAGALLGRQPGRARRAPRRLRGRGGVRARPSRPARPLRRRSCVRCRERLRAHDPLTGRAEDARRHAARCCSAPCAARSTCRRFAAALPEAIDAAARGDYAGLVGLSATFSSGKASAARARHASLGRLRRGPARAGACFADRPGADFGDAFVRDYERLCAGWPRGAVPPAFYAHRHERLAGARAERRPRSGDAAAPRRARRARARADGPARRRRQRRPWRAGHRLHARRRLPLHRRGRRPRRARGRRRPAPRASRARRRSFRSARPSLARGRRRSRRDDRGARRSPSRSPRRLRHAVRAHGPPGRAAAPCPGRARRRASSRPTARSPACSAPTAPARRRRCACSPR